MEILPEGREVPVLGAGAGRAGARRGPPAKRAQAVGETGWRAVGGLRPAVTGLCFLVNPPSVQPPSPPRRCIGGSSRLSGGGCVCVCGGEIDWGQYKLQLPSNANNSAMHSFCDVSLNCGFAPNGTLKGLSLEGGLYVQATKTNHGALYLGLDKGGVTPCP